MACGHKNAELIPSYYSDTEWCRECGAARGTDGTFGPGAKMLEWMLPGNIKPELPPEPAKERAIDTTNHSLVALRGDQIVFILPLPQILPPERAINLAAYLVAMADMSEGHRDFLETLKAIESV